MPTRISGFSSGLDIDSLVTSLMRTERAQRNKLEQRKYTIQYQREDYLKVNTQLTALQKKASSLKLTANINKMKTEVNGDTSGVSVSSSSSSTAASYTVKVNQVATRSSVTSDPFITNSASFDPTKSLASQSSNLSGITGDGTSAVDYSFKINGVEISVDADSESLNNVINKINNSQAGVTAVLDSKTGKINLQSKTAGLVNGQSKTEEKITLEDTKKTGNLGFLTDVLKLDASAVSAAQGAEIEVNGITMQNNTNDFTVNGVKITAKTKDASVTIESKRDVDAMVSNIKDFIQSFNDTLSLINTEYGEKHNRNYNPLTQEERSDMTENDAKLWDEQAKKGMLYRDSVLSKVRNDLKTATITEFTSTKSGVYKTLGSIGISTTSYKDNGVLTVDEAKLREALENDPDAVVRMFTTNSTDSKQKGLAFRIYDTVTAGIQSIKDKAGYSSTDEDTSSLGKEIKNINLKMADWDTLLNKKEDAYYKKFGAMESAIQKYQSQLSSLGLGG
ncbi:flagellar filament capping protein FliD [Brevibacillus nitrificans]|uniref:flagellar filament capping protein FliD n=1 Tax=Brevibacillus nitrificans TaxID=651560 RepID=UPI002E1BC277|nr:flagellar filament capping protein FliD [Brevibacillus nitrificans]